MWALVDSGAKMAVRAVSVRVSRAVAAVTRVPSKSRVATSSRRLSQRRRSWKACEELSVAAVQPAAWRRVRKTWVQCAKVWRGVVVGRASAAAVWRDLRRWARLCWCSRSARARTKSRVCWGRRPSGVCRCWVSKVAAVRDSAGGGAGEEGREEEVADALGGERGGGPAEEIEGGGGGGGAVEGEAKGELE